MLVLQPGDRITLDAMEEHPWLCKFPEEEAVMQTSQRDSNSLQARDNGHDQDQGKGQGQGLSDRDLKDYSDESKGQEPCNCTNSSKTSTEASSCSGSPQPPSTTLE